MAQMEQIQKNKGRVAIVDASGAVAGRLATVVAKRLLLGETIHVVHSERAVVTGSREAVKARYQFKTTVGTRRKGPFPSRMPHLLLRRTVRGMIPYQLPNGRAAFKRLRCHIGVPPELAGKPVETIAHAQKPDVPGMTLLEISQFLGKKVEVKAAV